MHSEGIDKMDERKLQILVIEDEKPIADILGYDLRKEGFEVVSAYTGAEGLKKTDELKPDLVLLDWMLPDLSGVDILKLLTEKYNMPVIMLTARGNIDDKVYGLSCGADDYITKPFELTPKEFDLLVWLITHPRFVFTRTRLLDEIWGYDFAGDTRTVDMHIQRLRKKLHAGESIVTVFGVGYKYVSEED